jgi:hypothetical protein
MIVMPALITLAVTLLRLVGELQHWSPVLFNRAGGVALVGIVWLVPIFGIVFAFQLAARGQAPARPLRTAGLALLAFALNSAAVATAFALQLTIVGALSVLAVSSWVAVALAYRGWPELARILLAYAFAARVPVVLLMLAAIHGRWGTHYDLPPPDAPQVEAMAPLSKWFWIGLLPQTTVWIYVTVVGGLLFGSVALALERRFAQRP